MARKKKKAAQTPEETPRERVKRYLVQRFYTRFHMSLILMSAGFAAMLSNWALLQWGLGKMWLRYPIAITLAYLTFLAGVWLWLQYVSFRRHGGGSSLADGGDIGDVGSIGRGGSVAESVELPNVAGGGSFDGGGASGAWDDVVPVQALGGNASAPVEAPSGIGKAFSDLGDKFGDFFDLDGEAIVLVVLALLLIASVLILSGYIVWFAPDILGEAVFGATLAGSLARTAQRQDNEGWVMGVVKKTWWPFAIVFVAAMAFALYAAAHYPAAKTFGEALNAAIAG